MPSISLKFSGGTEDPVQLGTIALKPTREGKLAYAQNCSVATDKYGMGVLLPGPYLNNFATSLSAPIYLAAYDAEFQKYWLAYDGTNTLDCIKNIDTGGTPVFDNTQTVTLSISGKTPIISDIADSTEFQNSVGSLYVYATLMDTSASTWVKAFQNNTTTSTAVGLSTTVAGGVLPILKTQFDGNLYIGNAHKIDRINPTNASLSTGTTLNAVGTSADGAVPPEWFITALGEWNGLLVASVINTSPPDNTPGSIFSERKGSCKSRLYFWDIANNPTGNFRNQYVNSPSHYVSVLLTDLSGNLLAFGGIDEGRTTIYQYTGYGFEPIVSYIGDMPRNRHSVCFDAIGRLVWINADGYICRYNRSADVFENLGRLGSTGFGGIAKVLQGVLSSDFLLTGANTSNNATVTNASLTQFTGDGAGNDNNSTPLAISGIMDLPQKSVITNTIVSLQKALRATEKLEVRLYPQDYPNTGNYTVLGTMDYSIDGAVASKQIRNLQYNQDNASIGIAWKATASSTTAPGLLGAEVQYNEISNL